VCAQKPETDVRNFLTPIHTVSVVLDRDESRRRGDSPLVETQAERESRRPLSSRPIQQLTGQVSSQDNQYQCGQPLLQLGIIAPMPIASPRTKNQSTCRAARPGAKRAQTQALKNRNDDEQRRARKESGVGGDTSADEIARE